MIGQCISDQTYNLIILAGGKGSRMGESFSYLPKALAPIGSRTAIDWIIERHSLITDRLIVGTGTNGDLLEKYLLGSGHDDIFFSRESHPINNAISLKYALDNADRRVPTIVSFCDIIMINKTKIESDSVFYVDKETQGNCGTFRHALNDDDEIVALPKVCTKEQCRGLLGYFVFDDTAALKRIVENVENPQDITDDFLIPYLDSKGFYFSHYCSKVFEFGTESDLDIVRKIWES